MPTPAPNLYPDFNIIRLSHVIFGVTDLAKSRHFYVDTLGLQVTDEDDRRIYLRAMEERGHHCLVLEKSDTAAIQALSFKLFDEVELDKAYTWFEQQGHSVEWVERPYQGRTLRTVDCFNTPIEFYFQMDRLAPIHQKYELYRGVKPLRIDHFNLFSSSVDKAVEFYNSMGFRVTEYTEDEESGKLWAAWMHRKGGVHDIAFTNGEGPRLHHTAFWVPTPLNIIDLCDLMATTGYVDNIERGPGRHGISNAFFLYILDPDGHRIEIYCSDYQTVDPDLEPIKWDLKDPQRQTLWGAPAPRSWFEYGSVFEGVDTETSQLKATPIVAP
ncbi:3,4-dihydroxyphenylacetate 2,3-dioxygenase [Vreelandella neptunia]|uniref:3,4-dihydroxyphenylacetate 2,3-dioxygenase n=1 Tax=Vreelandella neptunia TaxID=115551 RepID=A0ABS9SC87_9GAMM|nr:3,4-dihydroxyphenylacetate 2,3-dioxygenase [Halomonas neptunia]MCH4813715.1 3,4-dihydroxyphenylacetate 2,3-dioxygenase [Halomonas neptunia]